MPVILLPFFGDTACAFRIWEYSPIKPSSWEKNLQNWEITGLLLIGKQPVFASKIGKIKSLSAHVLLNLLNELRKSDKM